MTRLFLLALAIAACGPATKPQPPQPPRPPAVLHPPTEASCELAQAKLEELNCRRDDGTQWAKTPGGTDFAVACKVALRDGRPWFPNCISRIPDCSMLMEAYRGEWCGGIE